MSQILQDLDYFGLDELLTPEERMTRETVKQFVAKEVLPDIERHFAAETFPVELVPRMAELGFFGANMKGYGCAGMNNVAYGLIMQELEAGDSGLRSFASVQSALSMYAIYAFGSEEQKRRYLPEMAQGKLIGCFGLTEPDHGSDPGGMETRARRDGRGWVLNGTKRWITNGSIAGVAIVWAKVDEGIAGFLVEKDKQGFAAKNIKGKFSMRASLTSELTFDDVRLDDAERLPEARGLRAALACLTQARYGIAWGAIGAARSCYRCALEYAKSRKQFSRQLAGYQLVQNKLVTMLTEINQGADGLHAPGPSQGRGQDAPGAGLFRQAQQCEPGARHRPDGAGHARRQRDRQRVPGDPPHAQPRNRQYLRGHLRRPYPDSGPRHHRFSAFD